MNAYTKIILIICDPVLRAFSEFSQSFRRIPAANIPHGKNEDDLRLAEFDKSISDAILEIDAKKRELSEDGFIQWIRNAKSKNPKVSILSSGMYFLHISEWLNVGFKRSQMLILNGDEFLSNPARTIKEIQKFMDLKPIITEDNFRFNSDQKVCFVNTTKEMDCISKNPGLDFSSISESVHDCLSFRS